MGSKTFGAIADRRDDLSSLVVNGNTALQAIADETTSLERTLDAAPDTLRQANTTFVNLRAALDDLDPLVAASYPATKNLAPFLRKTETLANDGAPGVPQPCRRRPPARPQQRPRRGAPAAAAGRPGTATPPSRPRSRR